MKAANHSTKQSVCHCDHHAPPLRVLRSTTFNRHLAQQVVALEMSGDATVDLILSELLDYHAGKLIGFDDRVIDFLNRYDPVALEIYDDLFREDQRRTLNRYKARAGGLFRNRLQERLIYPVLMIHFALAIRGCRLGGPCVCAAERGRSYSNQASAFAP